MQATKERLIFNKMYYVTVPQEIESFVNFINKNKPYDIIVDGLNIMFIAKKRVKNNLIYEVSNFKTIIVA